MENLGHLALLLAAAFTAGALNAVVAEGNFVGRLFFEGAGAGAGPTASAIVADIIDIARDEYGPAFAMPVDALDAAPAADAGAHPAGFEIVREKRYGITSVDLLRLVGDDDGEGDSAGTDAHNNDATTV